MKKVLHSFLSLVTSRISLVMLTSLPATGGTRRKSRILVEGQGAASSLEVSGRSTASEWTCSPVSPQPPLLPRSQGSHRAQKGSVLFRRAAPDPGPPREGPFAGLAILGLVREADTPGLLAPVRAAGPQQPAPAGLTCPGGRRRSPRCAARSPRSRRSRAASPAPSFAWREQDGTEAEQGEALPVRVRSSCPPQGADRQAPRNPGSECQTLSGQGPAPRCPLRYPAFLESPQAQSASRPHQPAAPSMKGALSQRNSELGKSPRVCVSTLKALTRPAASPTGLTADSGLCTCEPCQLSSHRGLLPLPGGGSSPSLP